MGKLFTSESVTEGHPDKVADQISDAILDALLEQDPKSRVAAETTVATGLALIVGEITTKAYVDISKVVRETVREIGYTNNEDGFNADSIAVLQSIDEQSADIALGVDKAYLTGTQNGVTVVYSLGTGSNRYCNDSQIRLYQGNTLTVSVAQDALTEVEFVTANTGKQLTSSVGDVRSYTWTGDASSVTFSVNNGSGNLQVTGLRIKVAGGPDIVLGSGDADGDGEVTFMDAVAIVNYLFGNTTQEFNAEAADMNGDGKVTITDAVAVVNVILNNGGSTEIVSH